ncbi:MAG: GNAT family N-acetyltransferase [Pseudonocardiaceae bacterium]
MRIRRARQSDLPTIMRWRQEAATWLAAIGSDQWSDAGLTRDSFEQRVSDSITAGETWIAEDDDGTPLGTIAVDSTADAGLWKPEELHGAYVIHRMIIDRTAAGRDVGSKLIDHAVHLAQRNSRVRLILDAWTTNEGLHRYYRSQGFRHVRTVPGHWTPSAALFEREVRATTKAGHQSTRQCTSPPQ